MALYYNGDNVSSINFTPQMTLAEYNALTDVTVKDKIDGLVYTGSLDDLKTTGTYGHIVTESSNAPTTVNEGSIITIQVLTSQLGLVTQVLYYGHLRFYIRRFYNNSWNDWNTIYPLLTKTVTSTTNANGAIALNVSGGYCLSCKVVGVNSNRTAVLFTYGNDWFADIKDPVNMSNFANTSVTVEVAYISTIQ